jgi:myo-inositol 2-dehydrogenase / D-chiro-inositol 1-dehydrogenase
MDSNYRLLLNMQKLKVGLVGLGRLGVTHAENIAFKIPNVELTAVCTRTQEKLDKIQNNLNVKSAYTDFNEMIKDADLDAVIISSSSSVHKVQIEMSLEAGLHIFCEKPISTVTKDAEELASFVELYPKQILMLGFMRRYDASYLYAKDMILNGKIGKPIIIKSYSSDPAWQSESFSSKSNNSGGIFMDLGIHDIDLARWYFQCEATSVYAVGDCYKFHEFEKSGDVDNGMAIIKFKDGQTFMMHAGRTCMHGYHTEMEIIGTEGSLRIGSVPKKNHTVIYNSKGVVKECVQDYIERFDEAYFDELLHFFNCIRTKQKANCTVEDGVKSLKIAEACKQSLINKELIYIGD